jgi:hypothetical protein
MPAINGALVAMGKEHHIRFGRSVSKRLRGAVITRIRELLGVAPPERYDPWHQHCRTCACPAEVFQRVKANTLSTSGQS